MFRSTKVRRKRLPFHVNITKTFHLSLCMAMNWKLQLLSHSLVFLYRLISLGKLTFIPLLNMHLRSSVSSPEPAGLLIFHLLSIYKSQIHPSLEYCYHVWGGAPKSTLYLLTKSSPRPFVSRTIITSPNLSKFFPIPLRRVRITRSSTHPRPFQISLPNPRTLSHKSSFIPRSCNLSNVLPSSCFPEFYNLPSFKSKINKVHLISITS